MFFNSKKNGLVILGLCVAIIGGCSKEEKTASFDELDQFIETQAIDKSKGDWKQHLNKPPQLVFDASKKYFWDLQTSLGELSIQFFPDVAPMHVSSTIYLTQLGFYDDIIFHRVIKGFMAQGGDPLGAGVGGPGYEYGGEFSPKAKHDKAGILSMANRGANTDGSQFFITFKATPHLNNRHTVFGEMVSGEATLKAMEALGSRSGKTKQEIKIIKASIRVEKI